MVVSGVNKGLPQCRIKTICLCVIDGTGTYKPYFSFVKPSDKVLIYNDLKVFIFALLRCLEA